MGCQRNACAKVVMQRKPVEMAVLRQITGKPVKLVIKRREVRHVQPPYARCRHKTARPATATNHVLHDHICRVPDIDAVVVQLRRRDLVLVELDGGFVLHFLVALVGILIMWAVAWLNSWYKRIDSGTAARYGRVGSTADIVGGR